jgi:arylsulfatase A-like enzyme
MGMTKEFERSGVLEKRLDRRALLKATGVGAAALALPGCAAFTGGGWGEKPNIILIMADDLGYGDLGCCGSEIIRSPNIDALACEGMKFTDYHSNGAVCSPTRAALLTGRYQQRAGIEGVVTAKSHRHTGMAPEEITFAEVLRSAGYATGLFGKWHLGYEAAFNPVKQGFDEFRGFVSGNVDYRSHFDQEWYEDWWINETLTPEDGYTTDLITAHGVRFIERHKDQPFCLYLSHEAPHYPYQGRKDGAVRIKERPKEALGGRKDKGAAYREMIEAMDEGVGEIIETIKRIGIERRTFVFFCSDNGPAKRGSSGPLRGGKASLWEGGHRVPAIAWRPGRIRPGSVCEETVIGMDLFPTMAAMAGANLPKGLKLDGMDLCNLLDRGRKLPDRTLFWRTANAKAVRRGPWKLVVPKNKSVHLFNLDEDLGEKENLAAARPDLAQSLLDELASWEAEVSAGVDMRT